MKDLSLPIFHPAAKHSVVSLRAYGLKSYPNAAIYGAHSYTDKHTYRNISLKKYL